MAASRIGHWLVFVVGDDDSLIGTYHLSPKTRLSELMEIWMDDKEVFGHWVFLSADEQVTYDNSDLSLEMVGETVPRGRIVNLRAKLTHETISEIFVTSNEKFHHVFVDPHEKVYEVMWRLPKEPERFEYNGALLNPKDSLKRAGLRNREIIYEPFRSITVRLSTTEAVVVQLPSESLVLQLKEKINCYEVEEFSLSYQGRHLKSNESIKKLRGVVEVTTTEFVVNFNNRFVSWRTKSEPILFHEFISQLSKYADVSTDDLETSEFTCVGCQRRICHSEDNEQKLAVECCKERSLRLNGVIFSDARANSETNDATTHIQSFHDYLVQCRLKNSRIEGSRSICRRMKETFAENMLDYNILTQCSVRLLRRITELEDKVKELKSVVETLKSEKVELEEETERLDFGTFMGRNRSLVDQKKKLHVRNRKLSEECKMLSERNRMLSEERKMLNERYRKLIYENRMLNEENKMLSERKKKLEEKSKRRMERPQEASVAGLSRFLFGSLSGQRGVKLLIFYDPKFSPASRPEVEQRGQYDWNGWPHIKCQVPNMQPGWRSFEELHAVFQRFFTGRGVSMIRQYRGSVTGKEVSEVTSDDDEARNSDREKSFCDINGAQFSWEEVGKPKKQQYINEGGQVFICGGGRRTVLHISSR